MAEAIGRAEMSRALGRGVFGSLVAMLLFESSLIVGAVALGAWLRLGQDAWLALTVEQGFQKALVIAVVCQISLYYADLYNPRTITDRRELFVGAVQALGATSFLLAAAYYWLPWLVIGRGVFAIASVLVILVVIGWRLAFEWFVTKVGPRERILLVGTSRGAVALASELHEMRGQIGVEIVGFVDPDPAMMGTPMINPGVIGTVADIPAIVRARSVDRVVVSLAEARGTLPMDKLLEMKLDGVKFTHLASVYEEYTGKIAVENLRPSWFIFSDGFRRSRWLPAVKRGLDVILSTVGLVLLSPVMAVLAGLVRLTSSGPAIYSQQRVGRQGQVFTVHKFRSMRSDAEAGTGAVWAQANDPRTTPLGRFMRRTRLDELPQLWSVLRGDMSFVGPRPERPEFVTRLAAEIPYYGQRHMVRPGLTGWAQVRYTYGASVEDALMKLQYDLFYIKNMSLSLDLFIIFSTVKTVLLRRGA
jgi:sugar transferase (PEP-CTERM system associated)